MNRIACLLALFALASPAAATMYRCDTADGRVYQQSPCADETRQAEIAIRPQDVVAAAPAQAEAEAATPAVPPPEPFAGSVDQRRAPPASWRCVAANGETFYRHDQCPAAIEVADAVRYTSRLGSVTVAENHRYAPVSATEIDRRQACAQIYDRTADRRSGARRDQRYSIYERNTGRDPCR